MTGDLLSWHLDVIFTETPEGWVLTDLSVEPMAGPGVFDAMSTLFRSLAERGDAIRGGYFHPTATSKPTPTAKPTEEHNP